MDRRSVINCSIYGKRRRIVALSKDLDFACCISPIISSYCRLLICEGRKRRVAVSPVTNLLKSDVCKPLFHLAALISLGQSI